jgi:hypothetical protein
MLSFLVFRISDNGQSLKPSIPACYIQLMIHCIIYMLHFLFKNYNLKIYKSRGKTVGTATCLRAGRQKGQRLSPGRVNNFHFCVFYLLGYDATHYVMLISWSVYSVNLKVEATRSSETLADIEQTIRCYGR